MELRDKYVTIRIRCSENELRQVGNSLTDLDIPHGITLDEPIDGTPQRTEGVLNRKSDKIMTHLRSEIHPVEATLGVILRGVVLILWYVGGDEGVDRL